MTTAAILWSVSDMYECSECGDAVAYQHDEDGAVYVEFAAVCCNPTCRMRFHWSIDDDGAELIAVDTMSEDAYVAAMHRINTDATGEA